VQCCAVRMNLTPTNTAGPADRRQLFREKAPGISISMAVGPPCLGKQGGPFAYIRST
jgi:hypothetical protein